MPLSQQNSFHLQQYAQLAVNQLTGGETPAATQDQLFQLVSLIQAIVELNKQHFARHTAPWNRPTEVADELADVESVIAMPQSFAVLELSREELPEARYLLLTALFEEIRNTDVTRMTKYREAFDALKQAHQLLPTHITTWKNNGPSFYPIRKAITWIGMFAAMNYWKKNALQARLASGEITDSNERAALVSLFENTNMLFSAQAILLSLLIGGACVILSIRLSGMQERPLLAKSPRLFAPQPTAEAERDVTPANQATL